MDTLWGIFTLLVGCCCIGACMGATLPEEVEALLFSLGLFIVIGESLHSLTNK